MYFTTGFERSRLLITEKVRGPKATWYLELPRPVCTQTESQLWYVGLLTLWCLVPEDLQACDHRNLSHWLHHMAPRAEQVCGCLSAQLPLLSSIPPKPVSPEAIMMNIMWLVSERNSFKIQFLFSSQPLLFLLFILDVFSLLLCLDLNLSFCHLFPLVAPSLFLTPLHSSYFVLNQLLKYSISLITW